MPIPTMFKAAAVVSGFVNGLAVKLALAQPPAGDYYVPAAPGIGASGWVAIVTGLVTTLGIGSILRVWFTSWRKKVDRRERAAEIELQDLRDHNHDLAVWAAGVVAQAAAEGRSVTPPPQKPLQ